MPGNSQQAGGWIDFTRATGTSGSPYRCRGKGANIDLRSETATEPFRFHLLVARQARPTNRRPDRRECLAFADCEIPYETFDALAVVARADTTPLPDRRPALVAQS